MKPPERRGFNLALDLAATPNDRNEGLHDFGHLAHVAGPRTLGPKVAAVGVEESSGVRVAIPRFGELIAPCFGYAATITIFTIRRGKVVEEIDFRLQSRDILDRVRLMRDQEVGTVICGGLEECLEDLLRANDVRIFSWVSGRVEDVLDCFMRGELEPGTACPENAAKVAKSASREDR